MSCIEVTEKEVKAAILELVESTVGLKEDCTSTPKEVVSAATLELVAVALGVVVI